MSHSIRATLCSGAGTSIVSSGPSLLYGFIAIDAAAAAASQVNITQNDSPAYTVVVKVMIPVGDTVVCMLPHPIAFENGIAVDGALAADAPDVTILWA